MSHPSKLHMFDVLFSKQKDKKSKSSTEMSKAGKYVMYESTF